jgi:hypothetical protein
MLASLASDDRSPIQLGCLSVCNTGGRESQEGRSYRSDKGVADCAGNRYSNMCL